MIHPRFDSLAAFVAMDGHGFYVWLSVALTLLVVFGNYFAVQRARRSFIRDARARLARRAVQEQPSAPVRTESHSGSTDL